ncbi:MAG: glycosyltransferase [Paracoccaceae bacterium]
MFAVQLRRLQRRIAPTRIGYYYAILRARLAGKPLRKMLLVSDGLAYTSEQQFAPIIRFATSLAVQHGFVFRFMSVDKARSLGPAQLRGFTALGLKFDFRTPPDQAIATATHLLGLAKEAGVKALIFDGDDDQAILWPKVLGLCDGYIKKHVFSDLKTYQKTFIGKSNLTDYTARNFDFAFADDIIPATGPVDPADINRMVVGWNIALDDKIYELAKVTSQPDPADKTVDVQCRASLAEDFWTFSMREAAVVAIRALPPKYKVHAPRDQVSQEEYHREMTSARISVSPFGCGELCWRDFESILAGALLVKPDMSHLTTQPDLFVAGETYAPVAWDYSDLEEVCARYLEDEPLRQKVVQQARDRLLYALSQDWFLERFTDVMGQFDIK